MFNKIAKATVKAVAAPIVDPVGTTIKAMRPVIDPVGFAEDTIEATKDVVDTVKNGGDAKDVAASTVKATATVSPVLGLDEEAALALSVTNEVANGDDKPLI